MEREDVSVDGDDARHHRENRCVIHRWRAIGRNARCGLRCDVGTVIHALRIT